MDSAKATRTAHRAFEVTAIGNTLRWEPRMGLLAPW